MKNSTKAWLFLSILSLLLIVIGHSIAGREGLLWGFAIALSINTIVYFYGDFFLLNQYHSKRVEGQDSWGINKALSELSQKARIPVPEAYIIKKSSTLAFSLGRNWNNGKVVLSSALLESLSYDELKGVLSVQVAAIKNYDTLAFSIASTICLGIMFIPHQLDRILSWIIGRKWRFQKKGQLFVWCVAPLASLILRLCISKDSPYHTDKMASEWLGDRQLLALVLWKLDSYRSTKPYNSPAPLAHLFVVNPLLNRGWIKYFIFQPSVEDRIKKLIGHYPV